MRRRVLLTLVAAMLWLLGVEVAPNLHLALHDSLAAHTHEGDATIFAHDGHTHRVAKHRSPRDLALDLEHGAHSLAHHHLALHPAPPPVLAPLPVDVEPTIVEQAAIVEPRSRALVRAIARGPPDLAIG
jgi:hypothetical protein